MDNREGRNLAPGSITHKWPNHHKSAVILYHSNTKYCDTVFRKYSNTLTLNCIVPLSSPSRRCAPNGVQQNWTQINLSLLGHFTLLMPWTQKTACNSEQQKTTMFFPPHITTILMFLLQKVV